MELTPLTIINNLRDADYYMQVIFTQGACYKFHLFLKSLFPNSTALINSDKDHIVTLIDGSMYDITGEVQGDYEALSDDDLKVAEKWTFAFAHKTPLIRSYNVTQWCLANYGKSTSCNGV